MAQHALAFLDGLHLKTVDVLGFSLGGMVAQDRSSIFRRMILVGTAPRGGELNFVYGSSRHPPRTSTSASNTRADITAAK